MRSLLYLVLGAVIGAVAGWAVYAAFYIEHKRLGGAFGIRAFKEPVSESFWRVSRYVALIGGLIGVAIVVVKVIV